MESTIKWQTGKPLKRGTYIVTIFYKTFNVYTVKTDYYHTENGWTYYQDDDCSVIAWCDLKYIEPYKK